MKKVTYLILAFVSMFFLSCSDDELANNNIEINKSESKIKVVKYQFQNYGRLVLMMLKKTSMFYSLKTKMLSIILQTP